MKALLCAGLLVCAGGVNAQQTDATFRVKKSVVSEAVNLEMPLYDFNLYPGIDTLDVNQVYFVNASPFIGQYDSVSAINMWFKVKGTTACILTPKHSGIAIIRFYKRGYNKTMR